VGTDSEGEEDEIFFIWPTTLVHKIDSESPFYGMSARDFLKKRYEIVVLLEGVIEQTGNSIQVRIQPDPSASVQCSTQARSSYLPNEVLWGYRFVNLLNFKHSESEYKIDYSSFNSVYRSDRADLSRLVAVSKLSPPQGGHVEQEPGDEGRVRAGVPGAGRLPLRLRLPAPSRGGEPGPAARQQHPAREDSALQVLPRRVGDREELPGGGVQHANTGQERVPGQELHGE
jgi:hypothetical protein